MYKMLSLFIFLIILQICKSVENSSFVTENPDSGSNPFDAIEERKALPTTEKPTTPGFDLCCLIL
jgi:hypothetical protein